MTMRILIVGAGAVGGYFGARLIEAGRDVTFLVRASRAKQLRGDGLRIVSPHRNTALRPKLVSAGEIDAPYDLIILGVKGYALEAAMEDFAPAVGPRSVILPMLNGMRHIDQLVKRFGEQAVIGGVCHVATDLDAAGHIVQITDFQQLTYGERSGGTTPRLESVDTTLRGAGFDAILSTNITQAMWDKWVMLASLGAITCLLRGSIGEIVAVPGGTDVARAVLHESTAIATACGYAPSEALLSRITSTLTAPGSPLTASMYRDLLRKAPVEADQILGDLLDRARAQGVETPLLRAAFVNLQVYEATLSRH